MDEEDRHRYNRLMERKKEKSFASHRNAVLDELAPKAGT